MLKLSMHTGDYVAISENIIVQLSKVSGKRVSLTIYADKDVPIVRGNLLERSGVPRPECLAPPACK